MTDELNFKTGSAQKLTQQLMDHVSSIQATKVFVSGYSSPTEKNPDGTKKVYDYSPSLSAILEGTAKKAGNVAYITSPTTSPDSVDAIATTAGIKSGKGAILFTALEYGEYVKPEELTGLTEAQRKTFTQIPKFMFKDAGDYSKISAQASDLMIVAGGRNVAITDFMNAVESGKKVVILDNTSLPGAVDWEKNADGSPKRPNNASSFIYQKISGFLDGIPTSLNKMPDMGMSDEWMIAHCEQLKKIVHGNVISFDPADPKSIRLATDSLSSKISELDAAKPQSSRPTQGSAGTIPKIKTAKGKNIR
jgi:hypothetical protein